MSEISLREAKEILRHIDQSRAAKVDERLIIQYIADHLDVSFNQGCEHEARLQKLNMARRS